MNKLDELWTKLEKTWSNPEDIEDVYRIYPLLDTVSAISRKMLINNGVKDKKYKVDIVIPTNRKNIDTTKYLYCDEHKFFNGNNKKESLANIVSTFLHASEYVYIDTRKNTEDKDIKIYVFIKTDKLCRSCADANLDEPKSDKPNYRITTSFTRYSDCTCGRYVEVRSLIDSLNQLLADKAKTLSARVPSK